MFIGRGGGFVSVCGGGGGPHGRGSLSSVCVCVCEEGRSDVEGSASGGVYVGECTGMR